MDETLITIVVILIGTVVIIVFPMMAVAQRNDDIAQSLLQSETSEYVNKIATEGKITASGLEAYLDSLPPDHVYNYEIEIQKDAGNLDKPTVITSGDLPGENARIFYYTTDVEDCLYPINEAEAKDYLLNINDNIIFKVYQVDTSFAQQLMNICYMISGKGTSATAASASAMCVRDGRY